MRATTGHGADTLRLDADSVGMRLPAAVAVPADFLPVVVDVNDALALWAGIVPDCLPAVAVDGRLIHGGLAHAYVPSCSRAVPSHSACNPSL